MTYTTLLEDDMISPLIDAIFMSLTGAVVKRCKDFINNPDSEYEYITDVGYGCEICNKLFRVNEIRCRVQTRILLTDITLTESRLGVLWSIQFPSYQCQQHGVCVALLFNQNKVFNSFITSLRDDIGKFITENKLTVRLPNN